MASPNTHCKLRYHSCNVYTYPIYYNVVYQILPKADYVAQSSSMIRTKLVTGQQDTGISYTSIYVARKRTEYNNRKMSQMRRSYFQLF